MGAGKTTVLGEASDLLTAHGILHAAIDTDALGNGNLPPGSDLQRLNLRAVYRNFRAAGIITFLVAEAVEDRAALERLRETFDFPTLIICRLKAPLTTMQERIRVREPGMLQNAFVSRVADLETKLDAAAVEDMQVTNDARPVTEVATEMLIRAGWLGVR